MKSTWIGMLAVAAAMPLLAHHSFTSVFDADKPITLKGVVTKIEWANPHTWFYIDVTDANGKVENWGFESGPPGMLTRNGWKKNSLKIGDHVTVSGFSAKDGSKNVGARSIVLPDGRKVFAGTAGDGGPTK